MDGSVISERLTLRNHMKEPIESCWIVDVLRNKLEPNELVNILADAHKLKRLYLSIQEKTNEISCDGF